MNIEIFLILMYMSVSLGVELGYSTDEHGNVNLMVPSYFYHKGMNWFGAYSCFILLGIISPAMFVFKILKWLFTIGK